jgi:hypothetical protein
MPGMIGTVGAHGPIKPFEFFTPPQAQAPPQTPIDDGSDGWDGLASTFGQTAVAIAAWAVLCAGMTAAAQQVYTPDELPLISVDDVSWQAPAPPAILAWSLQTQFSDVDFVPPPAATIVDEVAWLDTTPLYSPPWNIQPSLLDQDYLPQIQVDELYWINPVAPKVSGSDWTYQPPPIEDGYLPSFSVDEVPWSSPVQSLTPGWDWNAQTPRPDVDYIPPPAATVVDEVAWQDTTPFFQPQWNTQSVQADQDYLPQISVDDIAWSPSAQSVGPDWYTQLLVKPDIDYIPQIAVSDDVWNTQVGPVIAPPNQTLPVIEQDQIARIAVSDDAWQSQPQWPVAPFVQPPFDPETLSAAWMLDEMFWQPPQPWPITQFIQPTSFADDNFLPTATILVVDEIYWFHPTMTAALTVFQQPLVIEESWVPSNITSFVVWLD